MGWSGRCWPGEKEMPLDSAPTRTAVWLLGRAVDASWVTVSPQEHGTTRSPWIFPETPSVLLSVPWLLILPLTPGFSFFRLQRLTVTTGCHGMWGLIGCEKEWRMPHQQACPDAPMRVISACWTHPDSCLADSTWRSLHVLVLASPSLSNTKSTREEKEGEHSLEDGSFYYF